MKNVPEGRRPASAPTQREQSGQSDALLEEIRKCVPTKDAEVKAKRFRLAQLVRGILGGIDDIELLRKIFQEWCRLSSGIKLGCRDTHWAKFLDECGRVKFAIGENPAEDTWPCSAALSAPEVVRFSSPKVQRYVSWFYELQKRHQSGAIYISTHVAAAKLGIAPKTAWEWAVMFEKEGILKCVLRGKPKVFATRYQYVSLAGKALSPEDSSEWDDCEGQEPQVEGDDDGAEEF